MIALMLVIGGVGEWPNAEGAKGTKFLCGN